MILLASALLGIFFGIRAARKREGNRLDVAQYAAAYAIAFMIVGLFLTLIIDRVAA